MNLARDPRIPDGFEAFPLEIESAVPPVRVEWFVDDAKVGETGPGERRFSWPLVEGRHTARASIWLTLHSPPSTPPQVTFIVK